MYKKIDILTTGIIKTAVEEAKKSKFKQRVGCVVFKGKRILSQGRNYSLKSVKKLHPCFQRYPGSVHAECDAIIKSKKDLRGTSILVIRINNKDQFRLAKPCEKCSKYIKFVGIKKVYYSTDKYPYVESE